MALGMSVIGSSATSASFQFTGVASDGSIELQIGSRIDFEFSIAPIYRVGLGPTVTAQGLNQRGSYYARARMRRADGSLDGGWTAVTGVRTTDGPLRDVTPAAVMIEPAMIVKPEPFVSMSPTGAVAGFPIENLGRDSPVAYRSTSSDGSFAFNVCIAGAPIDVIALLNTNMPEAATITVRGAATEAALTGGPYYEFGPRPFRASANLPQREGYHALVRLPAPQAYPWWRVMISGGVTPGLNPMLHAEYLVLGLNRMSKNHALEKTEQSAGKTTTDRKRSGLMDRVRGINLRKVDFELQMLTEAQYETLYADLWRHDGEPILVVPNSKSGPFLHDRILFGDFTAGRAVNPTSPRYNRQFSVESLT